jgi:hypothetical protein
MRSAWGRGVREGPAPQKAEGRKDKQSMLREEGGNMEKEGVGRDEEGPAPTE